MLFVFPVHHYFPNIKFQIPTDFSLHKGSLIAKCQENLKYPYNLHFYSHFLKFVIRVNIIIVKYMLCINVELTMNLKNWPQIFFIQYFLYVHQWGIGQVIFVKT